MRINTNLFWLRPGDWPLDAEGKVFLGRAVLALAASRFESPPMVAPLSPEAHAAYWKAADTIAAEAAAGRLVTFAWNDLYSRWVPLRGGQWAAADRRKLFRALFWFPGEELRAPSFSESRWPVYVEAESLAKLTGAIIEQDPEPDPVAPAVATDAVALTRPMFNLHAALCEIYGDAYGGYGKKRPMERHAAFSAWRNRLKPPKPPEKRLVFPGDIETAIYRLDREVFIPAKPVMLKEKKP